MERHGHPDFYKLLDSMADLHNRKNHDYAKGGKPTGNFDRVAAIMAMYPNMKWANPHMVAVVYLLKQLDAYLWLKNSGHQSMTGEGGLERLMDIAIYTGIIYCQEKDMRNGNQEYDLSQAAPVECSTVRDTPFGGPAVLRAEAERDRQRDAATYCDSTRRDDTIWTPQAQRRASVKSPDSASHTGQ